MTKVSRKPWERVQKCLAALDKALSELAPKHVGDDEKFRRMMEVKRSLTLAEEWCEEGAMDITRMTKAEVSLAKGGGYINAIKAVRERTALGLADAKDLVDRMVPKAI